MRADIAREAAFLLLELYGRDVVFDGLPAINQFLSDAHLQDPAEWREVLLAVQELQPAPANRSVN